MADEAMADLVLRGGKIVTVDERNTIVQALAARDGKIIFVGDEQQAAKFIGPETQVIDLGGKLAIPGFIEGHGHFVWLGQSKMILDLTKAETLGV